MIYFKKTTENKIIETYLIKHIPEYEAVTDFMKFCEDSLLHSSSTMSTKMFLLHFVLHGQIFIYGRSLKSRARKTVAFNS